MDKMLNFLTKSKLFLFVFYGCLLAFIFSASYALVIDPDFGWHMRYGEEVVINKKIHTSDTFSHTFAGANVLDTEWLTEAVFYTIFSRYSFFGLALFSAFFTSLAFFLPLVFTSGDLLVKFVIALLATVGSSHVLMVGARPQNVSLVFFSILTLLLLKIFNDKKLLLLPVLPLLFYVWAKAHPGFFLGLALLAIFFATELVSLVFRRKNTIKLTLFLLTVFILIFLVLNVRSKNETAGRLSLDLVKTIIMPVSVVSQTSALGSTRLKISEWQPPVLVNLSGTVYLLAVIYAVGMLVARPLTKIDVRNLIIILGFIYFSSLSRRNIPFFFLVFLPLAIPYTQEWLSKVQLFKFANLAKVLAIFFMLLVIVQKISGETKMIIDSSNSESFYCDIVKYPCKAIEFIKANKLPGKMFNHYDWGGWLIFKLSKYPVFVDGRVTGDKIFTEFDQVYTLADGWEAVLDKYQVDWILMPRNLYFEEKVTQANKWKEKYSDNIAVILVRQSSF